MSYRINTNFRFSSGFTLNHTNVQNAVNTTNNYLKNFPSHLYITVDLKTSSSIVGALFCSSLAQHIPSAIVNPIEKGHPDIVPTSAANATEEQLRNYPNGLEIKTTVGNIRKGSGLRAGHTRILNLTGITWQAHHQEVRELMSLIWDFANVQDDFNYPMITGVYFSKHLLLEDWGAISGTTGRNTKVCGMKASGRAKMKSGWIMIHENYYERYNQLL
ncbi:hypothetical protein KAJ27_08215 [bacterium]|nr:hypothetical protein [bacterium]